MMTFGVVQSNCNAWTSYIDSVVVTTRILYYIVVDGYGGVFGQYRLDVDYFKPADLLLKLQVCNQALTLN